MIAAVTSETAGAPQPCSKDNLRRLAKGLAERIRETSRPRSPQLHLVEGPATTRLFLPNGSRLLAVPSDVDARLQRLLDEHDEGELRSELAALGVDVPPAVTDEPLQDPPLHVLSLSIAQKCNMGCTYCYANQGDFGGTAKNMPLATALSAVDLLLRDLAEGSKAQLTFLGGEPLLNRNAVRAATEYAATQARSKGIRIGFAITTNGTLLRADDADFFEQHGFAVTVSLDGIGKAHDRLRPMRGGADSYDRIAENVCPLLKKQRTMQVSARITVTPSNGDLPAMLEGFIGMGFHSVGFSPLINSSSGHDEMNRADLRTMLESMIECGLHFEQAVLQGRRYPFLNMVNALKEIDRRTHRPYPCGAGAGYLSVSADGDLAACHRFVNEPVGAMGRLDTGIDSQLRNQWLDARHVHRQSPCRECWARYLCGGGCHHEVLAKGRGACDYIRGWLHYALQVHDRLSRLAPGWFRNGAS